MNTRRSDSQRFLGAVAVLCLALVAGPAVAQENLAQPEFTPALFILGSYTNDELRTGDSRAEDGSLSTEIELPFTFRGPRWQGGLSLNPAYRKFRTDKSLDSLDTSFNGWLDGSMSPRSSFHATVGVVHSPELTVLDVADLVAPRTDRIRARGSMGIVYRLSPAGDSVRGSVRFGSINYLDDLLDNQQSYGAQVGYGKALGVRASVSVFGGADRVTHENGSWVNAYTPIMGFGYRIGPNTDLQLGGGLSFLDGQLMRDAGPVRVDGSTIAVRSNLRHSAEDWNFALTADRRIASGIALGEPTIRSQLTVAAGYADHRLRLGLSGGFSVNELLGEGDGSVVLLSASGLTDTGSARVETFSSCVDLGYRVTRWVSVVGSGSFAVQRTTGAPESLDLDFYRFSFGFAVHPYAGPIATARGERVLTRYGRAGIIGSC